MWDPTKSYHEELKQLEKKRRGVTDPKVNSADRFGAVPLEVASAWRKFASRLQRDSDDWNKKRLAREEAKKWVISFLYIRKSNM